MMTQQKTDILFLTETRSKSYYTYNSQGYLFIVSGSLKDAFAGIPTIVAPRLRPYLCEVIQHNPRHATIFISSSSGTMHFHGVYAPHDKLDYESTKVPFSDTLENYFSATPLPEPSYIIGDLNVRLQGRSSQEHNLLGPRIFGKGPQAAKRGSTDNRTFFTNMLRGQMMR